MPVFPKPKLPFTVDVPTEVAALRQHKQARQVPAKAADSLILGTWNIANFGAQQREAPHHQLIAEILSWFDVIAIQECRDNFGPLFDVLHYMGADYATVMSDAAGNDERMVMVYDQTKVTLLEEVGEIAFPVSQLPKIKLKNVKRTFEGFDRSPYITSFRLNADLSILVVNVHLYYGDDKQAARERRALETAAVARWASLRRKSKYSFAREVVAIGDFNMPKPDTHGGNIVYDALTSEGLVTPAHSSQIASAIASDNQYDQAAIFPQTSKDCVVDVGIFDYDQVIFRSLWQSQTPAVFKGYLRYYMSDHRPMWVRMKMN